ncbi:MULTISPECIES: DUF3237 family protein [unclassified Novosphingobium]|jgi:hypothetical protein|uniref:DUF3237 family protein n=1 Tax=unclassified Novosphingobium TaxID=2644732 RepID=UPI00061BBA02|nr:MULTISPECIES: DUF3237 family protein [unclassified Novosphingobium]GAO53522.1 hypothetical protein NMD1_00528 [Novosphingobium sp. MD-1]
MTTPHPFQPRLEHAFTISITLSRPSWVTPAARGDSRAAIYAKDGVVEGPRLNGRVVPMSGGDFPLTRPNGVIDFDARYLLEADDGAIIYLENRGFRWARNDEIAGRMRRNEPVGFDDYYMRVTPRFDAPEGPHAWLSQHVFVGVAEKIPGANRIHYFVVL